MREKEADESIKGMSSDNYIELHFQADVQNISN